MKIPFVDLYEQYCSIKEEIDEAISSVIRESAFIGGSNNKVVTQFENEFAGYLDVKHCVSCANGTDSLEILLKSYGIGPGDEVIVPALTWISTSEAVSNAGAKPIFVDVLQDRYTIDYTQIEFQITPATKAIIPVHLYGLPAEMDEIMLLAAKHDLIVIEDCAQAHGAEYKNRKVGTIGHAASFSFYPGKNLGAYGDAGCIITNDSKIADICRMIANHGQKKKHEHVMEGRNSRLDGIHAAVLTIKLKHLDRWNEKRRELAMLYKDNLPQELKTQMVPLYSKHVFHIFAVQVPNRDKIFNDLLQKEIGVAIHYPKPLPYLAAYKHLNYSVNDFPVANKICTSLISLPMYPELIKDQIKVVASQFPFSLE